MVDTKEIWIKFERERILKLIDEWADRNDLAIRKQLGEELKQKIQGLNTKSERS